MSCYARRDASQWSSIPPQLSGSRLGQQGCTWAVDFLRCMQPTLRPTTRCDTTFEPLSTPVERRTPYLGARGVRRYFDDLDSTWDEFRVTVERVRAHADYVVAGGRILARQASVVIDDPTGFAFRLRDGKVVWAKVYGSEDEALAAAGSN